MKALFTSIFMLLAITTFSQKKVATEIKGEPTKPYTVVISNPATITGVKGVVKSHVDKMCAMHIEVVVKGLTVKYFVTDLPAKFQNEGTKIVFDYVQTDQETSESCGFDKSISVSNVRMQRVR